MRCLPSRAAQGRIGAPLCVHSATTWERLIARLELSCQCANAVAVVQLVGAGLLATGFTCILNVDAGMDQDRTVLRKFPARTIVRTRHLEDTRHDGGLRSIAVGVTASRPAGVAPLLWAAGGPCSLVGPLRRMRYVAPAGLPAGVSGAH